MKTFKECASCGEKSGSPQLYPNCLYNRDLIATLNEKLKRWDDAWEHWLTHVEDDSKLYETYETNKEE